MFDTTNDQETPGKPRCYRFEDDGIFPNSRLPLLVYPRVVTTETVSPADWFERRFLTNGWPPAWRDGIYPFHHYHSTAHEVLGMGRDRATIAMGGSGGVMLDGSAGDVVVIPAGVANKRETASADFLVLGAYPSGQRWDMHDGRPGERPGTDRNILRVPMPPADPVSGTAGGLMHLWL